MVPSFLSILKSQEISLASMTKGIYPINKNIMIGQFSAPKIYKGTNPQCQRIWDEYPSQKPWGNVRFPCLWHHVVTAWRHKRFCWPLDMLLLNTQNYILSNGNRKFSIISKLIKINSTLPKVSYYLNIHISIPCLNFGPSGVCAPSS